MANNAVQPIKTIGQIAAVRTILRSVQEHSLFTLAINTGYRGGDLLAVTIADARKAVVTGKFVVKEQKTGKTRAVALGAESIEAIKAQLIERGSAKGSETLFVNAKGDKPMLIQSYSRLFKAWCARAGMVGDFASHSGRKTFGYVNRKHYGVDADLLMKSFGHSSAAITLEYMGFADEELAALSQRGL